MLLLAGCANSCILINTTGAHVREFGLGDNRQGMKSISGMVLTFICSVFLEVHVDANA
jgi:hypothetical protein